ncbi:MAG: hypothetical protein AAGB51_05680 [Planctomycetota bacterium]
MQKLLSLLATAALLMPAPFAAAQPITYQGRLEKNGVPYDGSVDLRFGIWNSQIDGSLVDPLVEVPGASVSGGLLNARFSVDSASLAKEVELWLEIQVRPAGTAAYETLSPRQPFDPPPVAQQAKGAQRQPSGAVVFSHANAAVDGPDTRGPTDTLQRPPDVTEPGSRSQPR